MVENLVRTTKIYGDEGFESYLMNNSDSLKSAVAETNFYFARRFISIEDLVDTTHNSSR